MSWPEKDDRDRTLTDRLVEELCWWLNWGGRGAGKSKAVPRRSYAAARRAGVKLVEEFYPMPVGTRGEFADGAVFGLESGQTGRSSSAPPAEPSTGPAAETGLERPTSNNSGRSDVCRRCGRAGHVAQRDSTDPFQPAGNNCRRAIGQCGGPFSPAKGSNDGKA